MKPYRFIIKGIIFSLFIFSFYLMALQPGFAVPSSGGSKTSILVYPFENTGDSRYSWLGTGMTDSVIADLAKIRDIYVIPDSERKKAFKELALGQSGMVQQDASNKVGKAVGADFIFTGSFIVLGSQVRVIAKLLKVETGTIEKSIKIDGLLGKIFELQDQIVVGLMQETAKISRVQVSHQEIKTIQNKDDNYNLNAYEWYSKGLAVNDSNPKQSLEYYRKALEIEPDYLNALLQAGWTAGGVFNDFTEGLEYLNRAEKIIIRRGEEQGSFYANLLNNTGLVYWKKGELGKALDYYSRAKVLRENLQTENSEDYANLLMNMGIIYWSWSKLDEALEYYHKSMELRKRLGATRHSNYANLVMNIGLVYWNKNSYDKALEYYFESKKIKEELGLQGTKDYALLLNNMGLIYWNKGELDKALDLYLQGVEISRKLGLERTDMHANLTMNIGLIYWSQKDDQKALKYYIESQVLRDSLGLNNTTNYGHLMYNIALVYRKRSDTIMAKRFFQRAYQTYIKAGYEGPFKDHAKKYADESSSLQQGDPSDNQGGNQWGR